MNNVFPIFVVAIIFCGPALIIYIVSSFRLRNRILDAGKLDLDPGQIRGLFRRIEFSKTTPLKWGLILLCGGIGLIIISYVSYDATSTLPWGIEVVTLSIGSLLYYFILKSKEVTSGE